MAMKRRTIVGGGLAGATVMVAASAGLLSPRMVLASYPEKAFGAKSVDDAIGALLGGTSAETSDKVTVKAPDIAENGAVVPITVETDLDAESISIVAVKNPSPLVGTFDMADNTEGFVSTRIKMGTTSDVMAVVKAGGKLYKGAKEVKVTIGGCGG